MAPAYQQAGQVAVRRGVFCPHCQQRTNPQPFFSRGVNIGKLVLLFPFTSFVGPLLFFLWRRDRAVCSWCRGMLPGETPTAALDAFSAGQTALVAGSPEAALAAEQESMEIARLESHGRRSRARAWTMGMMTAATAAIGGSFLASSVDGGATFFFAVSGVSGLSSFLAAKRAGRQREAAAGKRQRQRVLQVLGLARANRGRLNVTTVAAHLGLDFPEAEAVLDGMVDGRRVDVEVDDQGRIHYTFPELR